MGSHGDSDDFGAQEPGTNAEILSFSTTNYGIKFDMFDKIHVKGPDQHPLYAKFLINRQGNVLQRYKSGVHPTSTELVRAIEQELNT